MAHRGRGRGRGEGRPPFGRGGRGFGNLGLRDEGLRITVPNFGNKPQPQSKPPEVRSSSREPKEPPSGPGGSSGTSDSFQKSAVPGFKTNAFKPIGGPAPVTVSPPKSRSSRSPGPVTIPLPVKRPVGDRLGPPPESHSPPAQRESLDDCEPISPGGFESPDESIRITVGNERYLPQDGARGRYDDRRKDRDLQSRKDSSRSRDPGRNGRDRDDGRGRGDNRGSKDYGRGYKDSRGGGRQDNRGYRSDRDRDRQYEKDRRPDKSKYRESSGRRSSRSPDSRSRGHHSHSRETSEDRHSRSSRQDSRSRDTTSFDNKKGKDEGLDLYDDLPASENLQYPAPQEDIFKSGFITSNWEKISMDERAREKEEEERHFQDVQERERHLRDEILRENSERQSRQQFQQSRFAPEDRIRETRPEERQEGGSYSFAEERTRGQETLPGLGDIESHSFQQSPPAQGGASILPGMAQTMDIEDEDEFLYGGDNDEPKTSQARVQPESQAIMQGRLPDRPLRQAPPPERPQVIQRPPETSYTDRRSDQPAENLSVSQTELRKRLLGHEDLVLKLLTQDNMLRERLESIASGDPREEALRQKQRELVALLTGISSSLGQPNLLQNPVMVSDPLQPSRHEALMQPSRDTLMQSTQYGTMMQQPRLDTVMPMHLEDRIRTTLPHLVQPAIPEPRTTSAVQPPVAAPPEPEKPKTDSDPTIRSILKSIGFNFELSKLMQEKAQRERDKLEKTDTLDTFGIKQASSSFLKEGLSNVDIGSVFDPKAAGATATTQKKPSILLEQSMSYEERARKYREEQMKAYAQGKASPPPFDDSEKQKSQEPSPDAYNPNSSAPYYQDNTSYDPGYSQSQAVGYEERAYLESNKMGDYGYYGVVPQEYGEEPTSITSSNLTVIQPVETEQPSMGMGWQDPNAVPVSSQQQQQQFGWGYQEFGSQQGERGWRGGPDPSSMSSSAPFDPVTGSYDPHRDFHRDDRKRQEDSRDSMRPHSKHDYDDFTDKYDKRSRRPSSGSSSKPPPREYKEKASNRTVLPPRHEQRRDMSPQRKEYGRDVSPKEERRRVYSPRREKLRARTDRDRSPTPERKVRKPLSPQFKRERDFSPPEDNRQYGPRLPSPMLKHEMPSSTASRNRDRDLSPSPARQKPDTTSSMARDPNIIVMTGASREKLAREMEERHKRLRALSRELERLRQQHNELLRKKKRQKDGHKDPLLLANSKLQDEIAKQISTLRKAAEDNAAKLAKAKSPEVRRIGTDELLRTFQRPPVEDIKTPSELMREKKALLQGDDRFPKEEQEQERPIMMKREPSVTTIKKTITVEKKEVKKIIKKPEKHYEYFDPGNHWCDLCNNVAGGLNDILQHMHSTQHEGNVDPYNRPWLPESLKKPAAKLPKANVMVAPLTGVEFLLPTRAFYCSLCKILVADVTCAEEHLKSHAHNQKYQVYLNDNPYYEKKRNLDKAARMTTSQTEAVKSQEKRKAEDFELLHSKRPKAEETGAKSLKDLKKQLYSPSHGKGTKNRSRSRSYSRSRSRSHDRSSSRRSRSRSRSYGRGRRSRSRSYSRRSRSRSRSSSRSRSPRHGSRGSRRKSRSPRRRSRSPRYKSRSRSRSRRRSRSPRYKKSRRSRSPRSGRRSRSRDRGYGYSKSKLPYSSGKSFDNRGDRFPSDPKNNSQDSDDKKRFSIKLAGKTTLRPTNILRGGIRGGRKGPKPFIMPPKEPSFLLRKKLGKDANAKDGKETIGPEPAPLGVFLSIGNTETQAGTSQAGKSLPVIQEKIQAAFQGKGEDPLKAEMEKAAAAETKNVTGVQNNNPIPIGMVPLPPMPAAPPKVPTTSVKDSGKATIPTVPPEPKGIPAPSVTLPTSGNQQVSIDMVPLPPPPSAPKAAASPSVALPAAPEKKATSMVDPSMDIQDEDRKLLGIDMPSSVATIPTPPPPPPPAGTGSNSAKPLPSQAAHKDASSLYSIFYSSSASQSSSQGPIQSTPTTTAITAVSNSTVHDIPMPTLQVQTTEKPTVLKPDQAVAVDDKPTEAPVAETVAMETDREPSKPGMEGVSTTADRAVTTTGPCEAKTVEAVTEAPVAVASPAVTEASVTMVTEASVTMVTEATEAASTGIVGTKIAEATEGPVAADSIALAAGSLAGDGLVPLATEATEEAVATEGVAVAKVTETTGGLTEVATEAAVTEVQVPVPVAVPVAEEATEEAITEKATKVTTSEGAAVEGLVTVTECPIITATGGAVTKSQVTVAAEASEEAVADSQVTIATEATEGAVMESQVTMATEASEAAVTQSPVTMTAEATEEAVANSQVTIATEATEGAVTESQVTMATEASEAAVPQSPVTMTAEATEEAVADSQVTIATEATEGAVTESQVTMATEASEAAVPQSPATMTTKATEEAVTESPVTIATEATEGAVIKSATETTVEAVSESAVTMATEATEGAVTESPVTMAAEATERAVTKSPVPMATEVGFTESPITMATEATEEAVTETPVTMATEATEAIEDTEDAVTRAPVTLAAEAPLAEEAVTMATEATVDVGRTAIGATNNSATDSEVSGSLPAEVAITVAETTAAQRVDTTEEAMDVAQVEERSQAVQSSASGLPEDLAVKGEESAVVPEPKPEEEALNQEVPTEEPMECVEQSTKPAEEETKPVDLSTSGAGSVRGGGISSLQSTVDLGAGLKTPAGLAGTEDQMMTDLMDPMDDSVVSELMQSLQDPEIRDMPTMMEPTVSDLLAGIGGGSAGKGEEGGRGEEGGVQDTATDLCSEAVMEIAKLAHSAATTTIPGEASTEEAKAAAGEEEKKTKTELDTSAAAADDGTEDKEGTDVDLSVSTEDADSQESGSPVRKPPAKRKPGRKRRGGKRW